MLTFGTKTDVGLIRTLNEDALYAALHTFPDDYEHQYGLFMVADGMGGRDIGVKAAKLAIEVTVDCLEQYLLSSYSSALCCTLFNQTATVANTVLIQQAAHGSSTLTLALITSDWIAIGHVGDGRCLLSTPQALQKLTTEHNFITVMVKRGLGTYDELRGHPGRLFMLYRYLGLEIIELDTAAYPHTPGQQFILCTDGITRHIPEDEIQQIVQTAESPQIACDIMVQLCNERGGEDNMAVIVVKV